jgi:shikimate dehydrogenase
MTRLFGVIGSPITHSLSPAMHTAAFGVMRLEAIYAPFEVPRRFLAPMLRGLILSGVEGLNVTVPLKEVVIPLLDRIDARAKAIGAVNTIVVHKRRAIGYNTDGVGFVKAVRELGWRPSSSPAVILGAGGSARAIAWELSRISGSRLIIANRHPARARRLARWLTRRHPRVCVKAASLHDVCLGEAGLLVNATTVGMRSADRMLIDPRALHRGLIVYDLIYQRETPLIRAARRRGCVAANGLSMLLYQGAASLRLWLNRTPPIEVMRKALENALKMHER